MGAPAPESAAAVPAEGLRRLDAALTRDAQPGDTWDLWAARGWVRHFLGLALYRAGQHEKAVAVLTPAVAEDCVDAAIWFILAMTQKALGRADEAKASYDKGLQRLAKDDAPARLPARRASEG